MDEKCYHCGETKPLYDFYLRPNGKPYKPCKKCKNLLSAKYVEANSAKVADRQSKYRKENIEKLTKYKKEYREKNIDRIRQQCTEGKKKYYSNNIDLMRKKSKEYRDSENVKISRQKWRRDGIDNLADWYVKDVIRQQTGIENAIITIEMIEAKRAILKAKRIIKEHEINDRKD